MAKGNVKAVKNTIWSRMFTPRARWEDKDEFLDVIYWGRQITAVAMGLAWGLAGLTGVYAILGFIVLNSILVWIYHINFNEAQDEVVTSVKEGFMSMLASFLVTWILTYTYLYHHHDD